MYCQGRSVQFIKKKNYADLLDCPKSFVLVLTFLITIFTFTTGSPITPTNIQKRNKTIIIRHFRNVFFVINVFVMVHQPYLVDFDCLLTNLDHRIEEKIEKNSGQMLVTCHF